MLGGLLYAKRNMLEWNVIIYLSGRTPTHEDLAMSQEEFGDYVKIVIDIKTENYTLGGRLHADGEKLLISNSSKQADLWGGGLDLLTSTFDTNALINTRPENYSQEILAPETRKKFLSLAEKYLKDYVHR